MKKTLIALAAVAVSGAAFAQSTVTIGGLLEIAPYNTQKITTTGEGAGAASVSFKDNRVSRVNTWGTSVVTMNISEDLGGGLRASGVVITEPNESFGAREHTLGLSGGFGAVRFGRFVPAAASGFHALSGSGSTVMLGSMYGVTTGNVQFTGLGARQNFERQNNVLQYTSPNFNGFTANVAVASSTQDNGTLAAPALLAGETKARQTSLHLGYANGPIAAGIGLNRRTGSDEGANAVTPGASFRATMNWVAGSYDFGVARVFAAHVQRKDQSSIGFAARATDSDVSVTSLGVSVPMDAFTFRASMYRGSDDRRAGVADDVNLRGYQLAAIYALSNRTSVVAAHGVNDVKRASGSTAPTRKSQATTLTVQHTF